MSQSVHLTAQIPLAAAGRRLDVVLAELFGSYSRSRLQEWIKLGSVQVDDRPATAKQRVRGGERVEVHARLLEQTDVEPQAIALDVRYADSELLVINKPPGLVVHPAAGNPDGTLQNALLHHYPDLAGLPRAGIVHRLDKDTTGLMVVARTLGAHKSLVEQLQARTVHRGYIALVHSAVTAGGRVNAPIGRHPRDRLRMAVVAAGKPAVSHYRVLERFPAHTLLSVRLETGRTHQIRVHMAHLGHPLVGDPLYAGRQKLPPAASEFLRDALAAYRRQALHAARLELIHPTRARPMRWEAEMPDDFAQLLDLLRIPGR
jgi:23S rRNA pseudouridine1911/1915/1917 synthase